jgi:hypothetical protein
MCWSSGSAARHRLRGGAKRPFHLLLRCMGPVVARSEHAWSPWLWLLSGEDRTLDRRSLLDGF